MTGTVTGYPPAERVDVGETLHGIAVPDPYRWLEDPLDPRTAPWLDAQRRLWDDHRAGLGDADGWQSRIVHHFDITVEAVPARRGARIFRKVREPGQDHYSLLVHENGTDRVLVDPLAWDPTGATVMEAWHPSNEGDLVAVQLSAAGTEDCRLYVLDAGDGSIVDGPIDRLRRSPVAWHPGGRSFHYVRRLPPELIPGEERYHRRLYRHVVGTPADTDVMVFGDGRERTQFYAVAAAEDGRLLTLTATSGASHQSDCWLVDAATGELRTVHEGVPARTRLHLAPDTAADPTVWLHTDLDAPYGRVVTATVDDPTPQAWRPLIAERPGVVLTRFAPLPALGLGLALWSRHAISELTVHDLRDGRELGAVALPGIGTVDNVAVPPSGDEAWFHYTDHATPPTVLRYDASTGAVHTWPENTPVASRHGRATQAAFRSADGTEVRMFVVSPTGDADRPRPAILTGYGGFGASMKPGYIPHVQAWVEAGGVYAIACLRGGGEEGEHWHEAGRGALKQNVFDDFAAAADHLVSAGWTTRERLGILGSSNGGLLVGAALTQHPEKFAAAVCMAPLLDMVRYERSGLGAVWRAEYGTAEDPDGLRVLLAYSPYHRVTAGTRYPPTLIAAGEADTRVDPLHALKMCAAMQHSTTGDPLAAPVVLRLEGGVGHGGRALSREVELLTDAMSFLGAHLGLRPCGS